MSFRRFLLELGAVSVLATSAACSPMAPMAGPRVESAAGAGAVSGGDEMNVELDLRDDDKSGHRLSELFDMLGGVGVGKEAAAAPEGKSGGGSSTAKPDPTKLPEDDIVDGNAPNKQKPVAGDEPDDLAQADAQADAVAREREERARMEEQRKQRIQTASTQSMDATIDAKAVRDTLESTKQLFRSCLQSDALVSLDITVSPTGAVSEVIAQRSEPDEPLLRDCVASRFKTLRFPAFSSRRDARMTLRLALRRD